MNSTPHSIREAQADDAASLSELALRSKGFWGYSREFLDACRAELTVDPQRIGSPGFQCFVAHAGDTLLGYYALETVSDGVYELEALFVEPRHIGRGVGRSLMRHALAVLRSLSAVRLIIQGDPNAHDFYVAMGARHTGSRESGSIPGRALPLYEIEVDAEYWSIGGDIHNRS